jgi:hypothetical protein
MSVSASPEHEIELLATELHLSHAHPQKSHAVPRQQRASESRTATPKATASATHPGRDDYGKEVEEGNVEYKLHRTYNVCN